MRLTKAMIGGAVAALAACGQRGPAEQAAPADPRTPAEAFAPAAGAAPAPSRMTAGAPIPQNLPADAVVLQRAAINDPGVIAPGAALTGVIPAGWSAAGGVVAPQSYMCSEPYLIDWRATSPDGRSSLAIFPTDGWQWSTTPMPPNCRTAELRSARDYLAARIAATVPGARILDYRERPDFAKAAHEAAKLREQMFTQAGISGQRFWAEGGEMLYAFDENGVDMRGMQGVVAVFSESTLENPMAGSQYDPLGGKPIQAGVGMTLGTFAATAPNGSLDFEEVEAVRKSFTPDPRWLAALFDLKGKIGEINAKGTTERAAIMIAGGAAATRANIAAYQQMANASIQNSRDSIDLQRGSGEIYPGSNAQDRMQRESIEAVRGVETYRDTVGGTNVQLDATYEHAWRVNNQDTYILTRDPNFNPGAYGIEATQMGAVQ